MLANAGAFALGRKTDELIIEALTRRPPGRRRRHHRPDQGQGAAGLRDARHATTCPDDGQRFAVIGWKQWSDLLDLPEFANAEFVGDDQLPWRGMQAKRWLGTTLAPALAACRWTPDVRTCFWYHKSAVGHAIGQEVDHRHHLARRPRRALRRQLDVAGRRADRRRRRHQAALPGGLSMAYQSKNLSALGYANGFTLWHYVL